MDGALCRVGGSHPSAVMAGWREDGETLWNRTLQPFGRSGIAVGTSPGDAVGVGPDTRRTAALLHDTGFHAVIASMEPRTDTSATVPLRDPDTVMRLARMGSSHQTRLSFMRALLRSLKRENWRFDRPVWSVDAQGVGHAVYRAIGPRHTYSLVAFAHDLPDDMRSDRVIATAWDATFALFDGTPTEADIARLSANVPRQEAGRISDRELSLSRANRSVRLWSHVVERLAAGEQPDAERIEAVGYLMRTTAVYGSGKFGAADRAVLAGRGVMGAPFHAEMLAVWLIRSFSLDLVEHMARVGGGKSAARIAPPLRRRLGIGNSTGLGMAPFLVNHPALLNAWITARETAIARVRGLPHAPAKARTIFARRLARARENAAGWRSDHPVQIPRIDALRADLARLAAHVEAGALDHAGPWDALVRWSETALSPEGQEQLASLVLEPHGALVDDLVATMAIDESESFPIDGTLPVAALRTLIERHYAWAIAIDHAPAERCARFWYVSEEKLEPRLGRRHDEPGVEREEPLDISRAVCALRDALAGEADDTLLADFLLRRPEHRHVVRRVQIAAQRPYSEIRDNLIDADMLPIDMLRCKLAFFGASRFDPRSDRWVRICLYRDAPFPDELADAPEDDWA